MAMKKKKQRELKGIGLFIATLILGSLALVLLLDMDYDIIPFIDLGLSDSLHEMLVVSVTLSFIWISLWILGFLFESVAAPRVKSYASARSMWKLISYFIWIFVLVALFVLYLGDVASSVLSLSVIGAALTFVLQKPLLNIIGWIYITYYRVYRIGDRISVNNITGFITDIRVMDTELQEIGTWMDGHTFTGRISTFPNAIVFDHSMNNYTKDSPFVWDEITNLVTYESDIDKAKQYMLDATTGVIGKSMETNFETYRKNLSIHDLDKLLPQAPEIRMDLKDSGVNLTIIYWCRIEQRRVIKSQIVEGIWRKFMEDPDVGIAYPHVEIVQGRKCSQES